MGITRGRFDYPYTCPDIDKALKNFEGELENQLDDIINQLCPMLDGKTRSDFLQGYVEVIYNLASEGFEEVRSSNSDIRDEANNQIQNAENQIDDMQYTITNLESTIRQLEQQISELENNIS